MGHWEDLFYEITESVDNMGMRKEFNAQLEKMRSQDKHKYKETRDRWSYAHKKIEQLYRKKASK